eukprot:CAMPEP_0182436212 /NCGR_PEP_ID=MMETSP1167-20130531/80329_1 /TAXON_ID=2988 /ORGANISM="Mallomonas Sp, Strain CCMP3275" /LENGTH=401 /DNA_ID=CAMNT_0024628135 /DNA_START=559 /DNA_END=1765 /DNA_ORIENTATION=-
MASAACALTTVGNDLYVFGGAVRVHEPQFSNELWRLDTTASPVQWQLLTPSGATNREVHAPDGRWGHTLVSYHSTLILFGGSCPGKVFNDVWTADISQCAHTDRVRWIKFDSALSTVSSGAPTPRGGHSAVVIGKYMYLFGGNNLGASFQDLWRLDLDLVRRLSVVWELLPSSTGLLSRVPSSRIGHCAVPVGRFMLIYGGRDFHRRAFCTGVYLYDTESGLWSLVNSISGAVPPRTGHCALPTPSGVLFFGGLVTNDNCCADVVQLDLFGMGRIEGGGGREEEREKRLSREEGEGHTGTSSSDLVATVSSNTSSQGFSSGASDIERERNRESSGEFVHITDDDVAGSDMVVEPLPEDTPPSNPLASIFHSGLSIIRSIAALRLGGTAERREGYSHIDEKI